MRFPLKDKPLILTGSLLFLFRARASFTSKNKPYPIVNGSLNRVGNIAADPFLKFLKRASTLGVQFVTMDLFPSHLLLLFVGFFDRINQKFFCRARLRDRFRVSTDGANVSPTSTRSDRFSVPALHQQTKTKEGKNSRRTKTKKNKKKREKKDWNSRRHGGRHFRRLPDGLNLSWHTMIVCGGNDVVGDPTGCTDAWHFWWTPNPVKRTTVGAGQYFPN